MSHTPHTRLVQVRAPSSSQANTPSPPPLHRSSVWSKGPACSFQIRGSRSIADPSPRWWDAHRSHDFPPFSGPSFSAPVLASFLIALPCRSVSLCSQTLCSPFCPLIILLLGDSTHAQCLLCHHKVLISLHLQPRTHSLSRFPSFYHYP